MQNQQISRQEFSALSAQARALQELMHCHEQMESMSEQLNQLQRGVAEIANKLGTPADMNAILSKLERQAAPKANQPPPEE